jgi:hypothetical protein
MPSLSHKRLHSHAYMLRVLSRAGQFAHLAPSDIGGALDELYDHNFRARIADQTLDCYAEAAVPIAFVKAQRGRLLAEKAYDARAAHYVAKTLGVTCCLCLDVDYASTELLDRRFGPFFCPTHLRCGNDTRTSTGEYVRPARSGPLPFCQACARALSNWVWRNWGLARARQVPDEIAFASVSWLMTNRPFRERVQDNAHRAHLLRFDPRRIPAWGNGRITSRRLACEQCGSPRSRRAKTCRECFRQAAPAAAQARADKRRRAA